jgi:enterochelin esterase-like enzyme
MNGRPRRALLSRRAFAVGLASLAGTSASACSKRKESAPITTPLGTVVDDSMRAPDASTFPRGAVRLEKWRFESTPMGAASYAVVVVPAWGAPGEKFPVVVALHGHGESLKSPEEGAMGWPRDYALTRAVGRIASPPLTKEDWEGFVTDDRLAEVNRALAKDPARGVIVACPYMPDGDVRSTNPANGPTLASRADFIMNVLLPRVRKELPALSAPESTAIDGISFGGALALRIGLGNSGAFGAVSGLQPALAEEEVPEYVQFAQNARKANPRQRLHLLTSDGDYFRAAVLSLSAALNRAGVVHDLTQSQGPHDYAFNRGPGSIEMLLWHERVLARG